MPTIIEANGQLFEGKIVECPMCGGEHETFDPYTPEGAYENCDDCIEAEREEEGLL